MKIPVMRHRFSLIQTVCSSASLEPGIESVDEGSITKTHPGNIFVSGREIKQAAAKARGLVVKSFQENMEVSSW